MSIKANPKPPVEQLLPKPIPEKKRAPEGMKLFTVYRQHDESGVSGTGKIIQGVLFADGTCCIQWLTGPEPGDAQIKQSFKTFLDVHVKSHPKNKTIITWDDGTQDTFGATSDQS